MIITVAFFVFKCKLLLSLLSLRFLLVVQPALL